MDALQKLLKVSTETMSDTADWATNTEGQTLAGRLDASIHFGKLATGQYSRERLAEIQEDILMDEACDRDYMNGYASAWQVMYNLTRGVSIEEVGYILP